MTDILPWKRAVLSLGLLLIVGSSALPTETSSTTNQPIPTAQPPVVASSAFRTYLRNPSDFTTILLIIGGDIVQKALAQLCGSRFGAPVAFSFGWVAYSFSTLACVAGDGRLMPQPEFPALVAGTKNGYVRQNSSWILARLLRDLEKKAPQAQGGLSVLVFDAIGQDGARTKDWIWYIGVFVIPIQFAIAIIPWALHGNWSVFLLTLSGTALALCMTLLPQWEAEKWCCRRNVGSYSLTRGNGHRHVFVIQNQTPDGLNLEDLATSHVQLSRGVETFSHVFLSIITVFWLVFLICAGALEVDIWYLLAIGFLGMLQNILVAGAAREPWAHGINLVYRETIENRKVMHALQDLENRYPRVGLSLLKIFFPGDLWPNEAIFWSDRKKELDAQKHGDVVSTTGKESALNGTDASVSSDRGFDQKDDVPHRDPLHTVQGTKE